MFSADAFPCGAVEDVSYDSMLCSSTRPDSTMSCTEAPIGLTDAEPDVDGDVELEADAESLSGSDGDSSVDGTEQEYFRFSRSGLSVRIDLGDESGAQLSVPPNNIRDEGGLEAAQDSDGEERQQSFGACRIVCFEDCCREKYPPEILFSYMVPRHFEVPGTEDQTNLTSVS